MANGIGAVGKELTETEKVQARYGLLLQATSKTQGDFANTSDGLANQMRILKAEVSNTQIEIGNQLLPVMAELLPLVRDLVRDLGTQLVAAVKAVDWKALTTDLMNTAKFFIENATAIAQLTVAIFAVNTAYKTLAVVTGIAKVATDLYKWSVAQATAQTALATTATTIFSTALRLIPIVAIISGLALLVAAFTNTTEWAGKSASGVATFGDKLDYVGGKAGIARDAIKGYNEAVSSMPKVGKISIPTVGGGRGLDLSGLPKTIVDPNADSLIPDPNKRASGNKKLSLGETLKREATVVKKQAKLIGAGVSEGLAARLTSGTAPVKRANKALQAITKNNGKLTKNLKKMERDLKVVADTAVEAVTAVEEPITDTSVQDALDAKERAYESFAESVKNTFSSIKNSILGAFDITQLGGSTNAITRNMDKLLVKLRSFSTNVQNLAGMGLNANLLQQVISAGPIAGAQLAEALVMGGAGGLSAINAGYSEFGNLAGQIATTGTNALFGTQAQQNVYNIEVNGGVGSGATIGKAIVDAIKAYERTSGAVWQGA
jgi:hypothetical protein